MKETPQTLWQNAMSFAFAIDKIARDEDDATVGRYSAAAHLLSGFALELVGKAFLLHVEDPTRSRHDLIQLYERVTAHGLDVPADIRVAVEALAPSHKDLAFRYMPPGYKTTVPDLGVFAPSLVSFVREMAIVMAGEERQVVSWLWADRT
ncbi:hypothetical protein [Phenylobacterium sp.]|uniref:hypothetical protein n=1 Tax=Phenylobacterium sp. TaxID=1871053 RepID=UPI0027313151|nr:hypothetical protein [Phenylobacterium sp.]MDP1872549.1 hypothetical protein [Phenylobacterium sp.]